MSESRVVGRTFIDRVTDILLETTPKEVFTDISSFEKVDKWIDQSIYIAARINEQVAKYMAGDMESEG